MTMHLVRGMSTTSTKKRKAKNNSKSLQKAQQEHEAFLKKYGVDDASLKKKLPKNKAGQRIGIYDIPDLKEHQGYAVSLSNSVGNGYAKEKNVYTGDYIKGIAVTHKSNLVPVTSAEQAKDISTMRRS